MLLFTRQSTASLTRGMLPCYCSPDSPQQACSNLRVVRATGAKFGLHVGNRKLTHKKKNEKMAYNFNYTYNFTCVFLYISSAIKYTATDTDILLLVLIYYYWY